MSADQLRLIVERIERLMEERTGISGDIRDAYAEAKSFGYSARTIRQLIARRAMEPHQRNEADAELATYEAALGMGTAGAYDAAPLTERRPDAAAIALELLTAEIVALEDVDQAAALVEHVIFLLDIHAEMTVLREQASARRKMAKNDGFDTGQLGLTVRWFIKVAKHGLEAMRLGEQTFHLYRGTVDAHEAKAGMASERDRALMAKFAGGEGENDKKTSARRKRVASALLLARAVDLDGKGGPRGAGQR